MKYSRLTSQDCNYFKPKKCSATWLNSNWPPRMRAWPSWVFLAVYTYLLEWEHMAFLSISGSVYLPPRMRAWPSWVFLAVSTYLLEWEHGLLEYFWQCTLTSSNESMAFLSISGSVHLPPQMRAWPSWVFLAVYTYLLEWEHMAFLSISGSVHLPPRMRAWPSWVFLAVSLELLSLGTKLKIKLLSDKRRITKCVTPENL